MKFIQRAGSLQNFRNTYIRLVAENKEEREFLSSLMRNTEDFDAYPHFHSGLMVRLYDGDSSPLLALLKRKQFTINQLTED